MDTKPAVPKFIDEFVQRIGYTPSRYKSSEPQQPAETPKKSWSERFFSRQYTPEELDAQKLEWLVDSGAVPELAGKLLETYLHSRHITRRKFMFTKMLHRLYKHQADYLDLERKAAEEIVNDAKPVYQQLLLRPEDKVALLQYMHSTPKYDTDDVKMKSKWFNRFRNLFKNFSRVATTFHFIDWLRNLSLPFAVLSIVSNFFNIVLDTAAIVIDVKRTFPKRHNNGGTLACIRRAALENNRIWNIIDSASACMSSITTVVLELAFGLMTASIIVGMVFTAFDAAFTIWGAIYNDNAMKAKIRYLEGMLAQVELEIVEEEIKLKEREALNFQRIRDLQEHLLNLQAAAEKCTNPEERLSLFRGKDKIIDTINELEEKKSKSYSPNHRDLLRHRKNFQAAIKKEKTAQVRMYRDTMVNMALFAAIMGSVIALQFFFPVGVAMLFTCALVKTVWKIYQRARDVGGLKAMLTGAKPPKPEQLVEEEAEAIADHGNVLLLSEEARMQGHIKDALEARAKANAIPGWDDEDILTKAGLQMGCKTPEKVAVYDGPDGGMGGAASPTKRTKQPISHAYLKMAVDVARADEKRTPDVMAWLYDGIDTKVDLQDAKNPGVDLYHPVAATNSAVPASKLLTEMSAEKRRALLLVEELARSAVPITSAMATPAA